jgi:hypothetical protein
VEKEESFATVCVAVRIGVVRRLSCVVKADKYSVHFAFNETRSKVIAD